MLWSHQNSSEKGEEGRAHFHFNNFSEKLFQKFNCWKLEGFGIVVAGLVRACTLFL